MVGFVTVFKPSPLGNRPLNLLGDVQVLCKRCLTGFEPVTGGITNRCSANFELQAQSSRQDLNLHSTD